jgi:hypothetical protein
MLITEVEILRDNSVEHYTAMIDTWAAGLVLLSLLLKNDVIWTRNTTSVILEDIALEKHIKAIPEVKTKIIQSILVACLKE